MGVVINEMIGAVVTGLVFGCTQAPQAAGLEPAVASVAFGGGLGGCNLVRPIAITKICRTHLKFKAAQASKISEIEQNVSKGYIQSTIKIRKWLAVG